MSPVRNKLTAQQEVVVADPPVVVAPALMEGHT